MRYFDVAAATKLIPLLNQTFQRIRDRIDQAQGLTRQPAQADQLVAERDAIVNQIHSELERLTEMGIEVKAIDGLVDFRALRDGHQVYLCWRFGETSIDYWHELHTGFSGRRPIENPSRFSPAYLS